MSFDVQLRNPGGGFNVLLSSAPSDLGYVPVWLGATYVRKPVKVWLGAAWVIKPAKDWTGATWSPT